ncbi:MAG: serine kinase [Anaerolineae bacterium]
MNNSGGEIDTGYRAYGLLLDSALALPELPRASGAPDVRIRLAAVTEPAPPLSAQSPYGWLRAEAGRAVIHWNEIATFLVQDGCEIVVDPAPGVAEELLRAYLLGSALGTLLQQRGWLALHASAVAIGGGAVAFLAGSQWGKSSLAAALYALGHPLVADDVLAVQMDGPAPIVYAGFPQLKLWPDALAALGEDAEALPRLYAGAEKRVRSVQAGFAQAPLPLRHVYVLAYGEAIAIEPLAPRPAFLELVRHSYSVRALAGAAVAAHFAQCSRLAGQVAFSRLRRPQDVALLPELARRVEAHAA